MDAADAAADGDATGDSGLWKEGNFCARSSRPAEAEVDETLRGRRCGGLPNNRIMAVFKVVHNWWAYMLVPQLTGKAQKVFTALEDAEAGDYDTRKAAILRRYNVNKDTYHQRL